MALKSMTASETEDHAERRLAAIMFTDIVGYTALTQSDETQALEVLERHNRILRPFFSKYKGREVKTIGDSFLVEFPSALDATRCAIGIQKFLRDYNISTHEDWKIKLRIGIHVGDVIAKESDIFGDAVNIASRIQPLAEPEGVCISEQVFDQVRNKLYDPLAEVEHEGLKNVKTPLVVYKIILPWERISDERGRVRQPTDKRRIAVLPFANISPDPNDEYFSDGITEEIISTVSRIKGIEVISRTSVMQYRKSPKPVRQISKELESDTILEGSVRKAGKRIRVTVQMIDASQDRHLWSETYDGDFSDVFAIQSDIAQRVARAMQASFLDQDKTVIERISTKNPEAHAAFLMGRYLMSRLAKDDQLSAIKYLERAVTLDSSFAMGYSALANCYTYMGGEYLPEQEAFSKAKQFAEKAIELDNSLADAHVSLGVIAFQYDWDWAKANKELTLAIEMNPNDSSAHLWYGVFLSILMRKTSAGLQELLKAEELDPLSQLVKLNVGLALYFGARYDEAIAKLTKARELEERGDLVYILLGWSYICKSMYDKAISELERGAKFTETSNLLGALGYAYGLSGRKKEAIETIAKLKSQGNNAICLSTQLAIIHLGLDESEQALELLEKALEDRETWFALTSQTPIYDSIRSDPRFFKMMQKIGLQF